MLYGLVASIIQIITLATKYRKWRKFAVPTIGIVGELKDVTCNYNRKDEISSYRHHYVFQIIHNHTTFNDVYMEDVKPDDEPLAYPGKEINILWSINEHQYLDVARTKEGIFEGIKYAGIFLGIPVLLFVAMLIIAGLSVYC